MISKLIIAHTSEIVRRGLFAILKSYFPGEVVTLSSINLSAVQANGEEEILLLCESGFENEILKNKKNSANLKLVGIVDEGKKNGGFDYSISLNSTESDIVKVLDEISVSEKELSENEGDELTIREREVLKLVARGFSNKMIADKLFISIHTVISHRKNITEKVGIKSISGLTVYAILNHLIDTSEINPEDLI